MRDGKIVAVGDPACVLSAAAMRAVFERDCHVIADPVSGTPLVIPALGK